MYKVILVDDEEMIINSLLFGHDWQADGFEVVATATSSAEALKMIGLIRPDVVFTDIRMPGMDGLSLMKRMHSDFPQILPVVISGYSDFEYAQKAMDAGAIGYCLKPLEDEEISRILTQAKVLLEKNRTVLQASFDRLMKKPDENSSRDFLSAVFGPDKIPASLCAAICCGNADSILNGCFSYFSLQTSESCSIYLILSNTGYLESVPFHSSLLKAASTRQLSSFVFRYVEDSVGFFAGGLPALFDECYSWFTVPGNVALGAAGKPLTGNPSALMTVSGLANRNRLVELNSFLAGLEENSSPFTISEAVQLYNFCMSLIYRTENDGSLFPYPIQYAYELAELYDSFAEMLEILRERLTQLSGKVDMDTIHNETLRQVLQYVNGHFTQALSFQDLCATYSINASYLSQLFRKELHITFTSYVTGLRIGYARELLESTRLLVAEISEKVGYDNYFHFTKIFKKETGLSPTQYRDTHDKHGA